MKKLFKFLILFILVVSPKVILAEESYVEVTNIVTGEGFPLAYGSQEDFIKVTMNDDKHYEFTLTGYNLNDNEDYIVSFNSDYVNESFTYKGSSLESGVHFSKDNGDSQIFIKVTEEDAINIKYTDNYEALALELYFNNKFDSKIFDDFYKSIAKNGKIKLDTINPNNEDFYETAISTALKKYENNNFELFGGCYDIFSTGELNCTVSIQSKDRINYQYRYKDYPAEFNYADADDDIVKKVSDYTRKFNSTIDSINDDLFSMDDMETVNFKVATLTKTDDVRILNTIINYSSEFNKNLENSNLIAILDARAGWDDMFTSGGWGFLDLEYNGIIYGVAPLAGVKQNNVIYVPDDTKDTSKDYINAAIARIKEYMPELNVSIEYAGQIDNLDFEGCVLGLSDIVDKNKTLGEYYKLIIDDSEFYFFIAKDSSKMKKPIMVTSDMKTNISITTEDPSVPLDSKVNAYLFNKDSDTYKQYINRLNLKEAAVVDLKLYSDSVGSYIEKLENGKFKVYIPITSELNSSNLIAYYITSDGKVEKHPVKIEGDYAVFETKHFSTYALGIEEKTIEEMNNPDTKDNVLLYGMIGITSLIGISLSFLLVKFKNKQTNK